MPSQENSTCAQLWRGQSSIYELHERILLLHRERLDDTRYFGGSCDIDDFQKCGECDVLRQQQRSEQGKSTCSVLTLASELASPYGGSDRRSASAFCESPRPTKLRTSVARCLARADSSDGFLWSTSTSSSSKRTSSSYLSMSILRKLSMVMESLSSEGVGVCAPCCRQHVPCSRICTRIRLIPYVPEWANSVEAAPSFSSGVIMSFLTGAIRQAAAGTSARAALLGRAAPAGVRQGMLSMCKWLLGLTSH